MPTSLASQPEMWKDSDVIPRSQAPPLAQGIQDLLYDVNVTKSHEAIKPVTGHQPASQVLTGANVGRQSVGPPSQHLDAISGSPHTQVSLRRATLRLLVV